MLRELPIEPPYRTKSFGWGTHWVTVHTYYNRGFALLIGKQFPFPKTLLQLSFKNWVELKHWYDAPGNDLRYFLGTEINYFVAVAQRDEEAERALMRDELFYLQVKPQQAVSYIDHNTGYETKEAAEKAAKRASSIWCNVYPILGAQAKQMRLKSLEPRNYPTQWQRYAK